MKTKKPKKKKVERLDYHECAEYIGKKLGYDLRDVNGRWKEPGAGTKNVPYLDFWHFITDNCEVHNGCEIYIPAPTQEWQKIIIKAFYKEFGEGPYWVEW